MRRTFAVICASIVAALTQPVSADTATDWMEFAAKVSSPLQSPPGTPQRQDLTQANTKVALAMFEAVNAIDRKYMSYLGLKQGDPAASQDAAVATAAYRVMIDHFPNLKSTLDDNYMLAMTSIADPQKREAGRLIGERAAAAALAVGGIDPEVQQVPYRPRTTPGEWVPTDLPTIKPHEVALRPWAIEGSDALRSPPPPDLQSERWARDYAEVKRLGGLKNTERTPYQTIIANYRILPDFMPALRTAADAPGRTQVQNARMLARLYMAMDDSGLAMADAKMHYNFWRPITAIRNGDQDGNEATQADPDWLPLLETPGFPEYPCGHCIFAAVIAEVMTDEVGLRPATGVRIGTLAARYPMVYVLPSWDDWAQQVSDSRIYAGAHFRFANEAGEKIGRRVGRIVIDKIMRPVSQKKRTGGNAR